MKPSGLHYTVIYITTGCNVLRDKEIVSCGNERREEKEEEEEEK